MPTIREDSDGGQVDSSTVEPRRVISYAEPGERAALALPLSSHTYLLPLGQSIDVKPWKKHGTEQGPKNMQVPPRVDRAALVPRASEVSKAAASWPSTNCTGAGGFRGTGATGLGRQLGTPVPRAQSPKHGQTVLPTGPQTTMGGAWLRSSLRRIWKF